MSRPDQFAPGQRLSAAAFNRALQAAAADLDVRETRDRPLYGIFELPESGTWTPGDKTASPEEVPGWMRMDNCRPVCWFPKGTDIDPKYDGYSDQQAQTLWHLAGVPPRERQKVLDLVQDASEWPAKFGPLDWVWAQFNEQEGRWQILDTYEDFWRFELTSSLYRCGSAPAKLRLFKDGQWRTVDLAFVVYDSTGVVCPDLCEAGTNCGCDSASVPAGTLGVAKYFADSGRWEVLVLGRCELGSSSGSSGSSSSTSDSSSGSGSGSGSGSSPSGSGGPACDTQSWQSFQPRCESGVLNVYVRTMTLDFTSCPTVKRGPWLFAYSAGCCTCGSDASSSASESSSGSVTCGCVHEYGDTWWEATRNQQGDLYWAVVSTACSGSNCVPTYPNHPISYEGEQFLGQGCGCDGQSSGSESGASSASSSDLSGSAPCCPEGKKCFRLDIVNCFAGTVVDHICADSVTTQSDPAACLGSPGVYFVINGVLRSDLGGNISVTITEVADAACAGATVF